MLMMFVLAAAFAGVAAFPSGKVTCMIVATTDKIEVESNAEFILRANGREYAVRVGRNVFDRRAKETVVIVPAHPDDLISMLGISDVRERKFQGVRESTPR